MTDELFAVFQLYATVAWATDGGESCNEGRAAKRQMGLEPSKAGAHKYILQTIRPCDGLRTIYGISVNETECR